jgi:hypothetical protein
MTPADSVDQGTELVRGQAELVESLEMLLATARAQLADLRSTLVTSIAFLQAQDHRE